LLYFSFAGLEHKKNLQNDMWRIHQVENSKGKANHPFYKFGTGSMETLKQEGIRDGTYDYFYTNVHKSTLLYMSPQRWLNFTEIITRLIS